MKNRKVFPAASLSQLSSSPRLSSPLSFIWQRFHFIVRLGWGGVRGGARSWIFIREIQTFYLEISLFGKKESLFHTALFSAIALYSVSIADNQVVWIPHRGNIPNNFEVSPEVRIFKIFYFINQVSSLPFLSTHWRKLKEKEMSKSNILLFFGLCSEFLLANLNWVCID